MHLKTIEECIETCGKNHSFVHRNIFVEQKIEGIFKYFENFGDVKRLSQTTVEKTKKEL